MKTKICTGCGKELAATLESFNKAKKGKYGLTANCKDCNNQYKQDNKESINLSNKAYRQKNKTTIIERNRVYRQKNKETLKVKDKEKYENNKDKMMAWSKLYMRRRRNTDLSFRILCNLRTRVCQAIKGKVKSARTQELIGCSVENLQNHLEKQFTEGMTWENYGEWHIDHIIPCSSYDLSEPEEQKECFHYMNLQPLWAKDNLMKSDKLNYEMEGAVI